jgi:hypothetical protein
VTPQEALAESLSYYGVTARIFEDKRWGPYQEARWFVWWRMVNVHGCYYMDCQRETGFNHSSVAYAMRDIERRYPNTAEARPRIYDRSTLLRLLSHTLAELGVGIEVLQGKSRVRQDVDERGAVWWYMHRVLGIPQQRLAQVVLGRGHGAVRCPIVTFERNDGPNRWGFAGMAVEADPNVSRGGGHPRNRSLPNTARGTQSPHQAPGAATCHPGRTRVA